MVGEGPGQEMTKRDAVCCDERENSGGTKEEEAGEGVTVIRFLFEDDMDCW